MEDSSCSSFLDGPLSTSMSDAELFKYFLNDDIGGPAPSPYSHTVPSISPPFCESPPLTPDNMFSDISDLPFAVKEEVSDQFSVVQPLKANGMMGTKDLIPSPKSVKSPKGDTRSRKIEVHSLSSEEERQIKRQRRLVKNRESAQLSRMRKKIYIDDLEGKVNALSTENATLKEEVIHLQNALKTISNGSYDGSRPTSTTTPASSTTTTTNPPTARHTMGATRNAQAAGVCLLIVLFSLGLLFNATATATANNGDTTGSSSTSSPHRHSNRRESTQFPLLSSISASEQKIDEIVKAEPFVSSVVESTRKECHQISQKRPASCFEEGEEVEEERMLATAKHKKIKIEPPSSPLPLSSISASSITEVDDIEDRITSSGGGYGGYGGGGSSSAPVAIAVVAPTHSDIISPAADLAFLSNYRSVNVHVWPMLR